MESFIKYDPHPQLKDFIEFIYEVNISERPLDEERVIPDGNFHLVFNFASPIFIKTDKEYIETPPTYIICYYKNSIGVKITPPIHYISIVFKPGKFRAFTTLPVRELTSKVTPSDIVFGDAINLIYGLLKSQRTTNERIDLINSLLLASLKNHKMEQVIIENAINKIQNIKGKIDVKSLSNDVKINDRYFRRIFSEYTGMSPKQFLEITKVRIAIRMMAADEGSISDICYHLDYFDLSHFNHSFKRMVGISPKSYLKEINQINNLYYKNA